MDPFTPKGIQAEGFFLLRKTANLFGQMVMGKFWLLPLPITLKLFVSTSTR